MHGARQASDRNRVVGQHVVYAAYEFVSGRVRFGAVFRHGSQRPRPTWKTRAVGRATYRRSRRLDAAISLEPRITQKNRKPSDQRRQGLSRRIRANYVHERLEGNSGGKSFLSRRQKSKLTDTAALRAAEAQFNYFGLPGFKRRCADILDKHILWRIKQTNSDGAA